MESVIKTSKVRAPKTATVIKLLGSLAITGLLLYAIFSDQSLAEFSQILSEVDRTGVLLYIGISLAGLVFRAMRYRLIILRVSGIDKTPSFGKMLVVTSIRNGLVDLLPARLGETGFFYVCSRYGVPLVTAASTFAVCLALDIIVLFGLFALLTLEAFAFSEGGGIFAMTSITDPSSMMSVIGVVLLVVLILSFALAKLDAMLRLASTVAAHIGKRFPHRLIDFAVTTLRSMAVELQALKSNKSYAQLVVLTALLRTAKYGGLYVLLIAVISRWGFAPGSVSPLLAATAFIGAEASASLPISGIMGFGAYEATWSLIFSLSKVEIPSITSVVFAVHIITQVVGYAVAMLGLAVFLLREYTTREVPTP